MILRIRLKDNIIIEIESSSIYLSRISSDLQNISTCKEKKETFLKTVYYLCAKKANSRNPLFLKKLIDSSFKPIQIDIKDTLHVKVQDTLEKYYHTLNSNEKDSLHVIRKRYLKLAKTYHPDRVICKDSHLVRAYTDKFHQIQKAYEVLKYKIAS